MKLSAYRGSNDYGAGRKLCGALPFCAAVQRPCGGCKRRRGSVFDDFDIGGVIVVEHQVVDGGIDDGADVID